MRTTCLGTIIALLFALAPLASADVVDDVAPAGAPATKAPSVRELVYAALEGTADDARKHLRCLEGLGGLEAAQGLLRVAREGRRELRPDAVGALGRLGVRTEAIHRHVRRTAESSARLDERAAALEALGHLAACTDDVDLLVKTLHAREGCLRSASYRAICRLSGQRLSASPARIRGWWRRFKKTHIAELHSALESIPDGLAAEEDVGPQRAAIAAYGWLDLCALTCAVEDWLGSSPELVEEAHHAIAALRLGDFATDVRRALRRHCDPANALVRAGMRLRIK